MTEAMVCSASNSEEIQSPKESTPELIGKQSQSTDCTSTSSDENSSHSDHTDDVDCQENNFNRIDYSEVLRLKDEKIKSLELENRNLRKICGEMTNQNEARMQELVQELDRHVEIIENLQTKVHSYERQIEQQRQQLTTARQQLSKTKNALSNNVHQQQNQRQQQTASNKSNNIPYSGIKETNDVKSIDPDDVCAALNSFVQKNRGLASALTGNDDDDSMQINLIEYLNAVMQNGSQFDGDTKSLGEELSKLGNNNMLSMLFDSQGLVNENNCDFENGLKSGVRLKNSNQLLSSQTVRDYFNSTKDHYNRSSLSNNLSNGTSKVKFNQQIAASAAPPSSASVTKPSTSSSVTPNRSTNEIITTSFSNLPNINSSSAISNSSSKSFTEDELKIISEMQERVSQNVARLGNRPINTIEIAKQCKRLMVAYNIGQRLFAKAVMCQVVKSQGSLSELLSKPRVWHKLTDKGREAFRRIFGWLSDDVAIELLCQLSPRRVAMPCDKIEHPTSESLLDVLDGNNVDESFLKIGSGPTTNNYDDNECLGTLLFSDSGEVKIMDDDEFSALRAKFPQTNNIVNKNISSSNASGCSSPLSSNNLANGNSVNNLLNSNSCLSKVNSRWRHDDIPREKIIGIFEAEKAKLREQTKLNNIADDNCSASFFGSEESTPASPKASSVHSLMLGAGSSASSCTGRNKVDPVPIIQEQFEKYPILDTEEVVKQIKDYLSRHSISQRQFGENVLGLSQGSVSDLLARPKAWSMLTHKGREPFIRMKIFLDEHANDENPPANLHSLSINDDKLNTFNYGMEEEGRETPESDSFLKNFFEQMKSESRNEAIIYVDDSNHNKKVDDKLEPFDAIEVCRQIKDFLSKNGISQRAFGEHIMGMTSGSVSDLLSRPKSWSSLSVKGRESYTKMAEFLSDNQAMSALCFNINNASVSSARNNNNLSLSTDVVTVRDLLTSTSPDVYSAVAAAVGAAGLNGQPSTSNGVRRGGTAEVVSLPLSVLQNNRSSFSSQSSPSFNLKRKADELNIFDTGFGSGSSNKKIPRFQRTIITDQQKEALFFIYSHEQRPSTKTIDQLSIKLGLSSRTVTNWFHNHRTRQKAKEVKLANEAAANGLPVAPLKPNPLQVADPTTKSWYKDLSELLAQNAAAVASGEPQSAGDALNNGDSDLFNSPTIFDIACDDTIKRENFQIEEETEFDNMHYEQESRILTPKSGSNESGVSSSQLDKVIARISNRLAASTSS